MKKFLLFVSFLFSTLLSIPAFTFEATVVYRCTHTSGQIFTLSLNDQAAWINRELFLVQTPHIYKHAYSFNFFRYINDDYQFIIPKNMLNKETQEGYIRIYNYQTEQKSGASCQQLDSI